MSPAPRETKGWNGRLGDMTLSEAGAMLSFAMLMSVGRVAVRWQAGSVMVARIASAALVVRFIGDTPETTWSRAGASGVGIRGQNVAVLSRHRLRFRGA